MDRDICFLRWLRTDTHRGRTLRDGTPVMQTRQSRINRLALASCWRLAVSQRVADAQATVTAP
jgi:hypothetical protein